MSNNVLDNNGNIRLYYHFSDLVMSQFAIGPKVVTLKKYKPDDNWKEFTNETKAEFEKMVIPITFSIDPEDNPNELSKE